MVKHFKFDELCHQAFYLTRNGTTKLYYDCSIQCTYCDKKYIWSNLKGSTSTLNKHFNSVHGVTRKRRLSNGDQPTLDFLNSKKRKYMNITDKAGFEAALVNFIISKGLPASIFNGSAFSEVVRSLRYELKLPGTNKLHDIIKTEYFIYRMNMHNLLQKYPSVDLTFDLWESGDTHGSWFICVAVSFISHDTWKREHHILEFQLLNNSGHTGEYLAQVVKRITDNYNITYKINNICLDSASNNLRFANNFHDLVNSSIIGSPHAEHIRKGILFKGLHYLIRCSSHIIHNITMKFTNAFKKILLPANYFDNKIIINDAKPVEHDLNVNEEEFYGDATSIAMLPEVAIVPERQIVDDDETEDEEESAEDKVTGNEDNNIEDKDDDETEDEEMEDEVEERNFVNTYNCATDLDKNGHLIFIYPDEAINSKVDSYLGENSNQDAEKIFDVQYTQNLVNRHKECDTQPMAQNASLILCRLRELIKHCRYYHDTWKTCLTDLNMKAKRMRLDVKVRWSSTYLMLNSAVEYKKVLLDYCEKFVKKKRNSPVTDLSHERCAILEEEDFQLIVKIRILLKPLYTLTNISSSNSTSVACWNEIIRSCERLFSNDSKKRVSESMHHGGNTLKVRDIEYLKGCSILALNNLKKYHDASSNSKFFTLAEFFHPLLFYGNYIKTRIGLNETNGGVGESNLTFNGLLDTVIDETVKEWWKIINIELFSNVTNQKATSIQVISFNDIKQIQELQKTTKNELYKLISQDRQLLNDLMPSSEDENDNSMNAWAEDDSFFENSDIIDGTDNLKVLSTSNKFEVEENASLFNTTGDIDEIYTAEWVLRRKIKTEIEEYIDLISSKEFLAKYLDVSKVYDKFYFDVLKFWFKNKKKFPYLSKLAQRCLIGTSSSSFVERVFSIASTYYSPRRKRLSAPFMESIMPLRLNSINESRIINVEKLEISLKYFKEKFGDGHLFADEATFRRGLRYRARKMKFSFD